MTTAAELPRLTSLSHGAGCACKLPLATLERLMASVGQGLGGAADANLLVGAAEGDDAAVLRLDDERALVLTTDFFTPIVDDARDWGRIAAANALSDVYAMGGRPLIALNLTAWPADLPVELLAEVLRGGAEVASQAGCPVVGGHSIDDPEPKYGMAVTGFVHPAEVWTNGGGREGDVLVLTKPIGTGIVTTAVKRGAPDPEVVDAAVASMTTLNAEAAELVRSACPHAVTDVTGFGLVGHAREVAEGAGLRAEIDFAAVELLPGVRELIAEGQVPGGTRTNLELAGAYAEFGAGLGEAGRLLACDAQTSGGLLVVLPPERAAALPWPAIGRLAAGPAGTVLVD